MKTKDKDPLDRELDFSAAKRGPAIPVDASKTRITIRLDNETIDWFKNMSGSGGYQNRINSALLEFIDRAENGERYKEEELEKLIVQVLGREQSRPAKAGAKRKVSIYR